MIEVNPSDFTKIVVGVDPAVTSGENADETGIVVVAAGPHQPDTCIVRHCEVHGYVLEDASLPAANKNSIERWAQRVVRAYDEWNANIVVIESNQGHELLESVMRTIRPMMPINRPNARYSKKARAEPIVALYEQGPDSPRWPTGAICRPRGTDDNVGATGTGYSWLHFT